MKEKHIMEKLAWYLIIFFKGGGRRCSGQWPEHGRTGRSIFDTFIFFFDAPASSWPEQFKICFFFKGIPSKDNFFA